MKPRLPLLSRLGALALGLALVGPALGCAKQLQAKTEYEKGTDFSQYQTYRWITDDLVLIQSGTGNENIRNVENEKRIRAAVERELEAKGLSKAEGADAQMILAFTVGAEVKYRIQGGTTALDLVAGDDASFTRGTLSLYFFDAASNAQVWQAWTSKDLVPGEDPDTVINAAVGVLMAEFPPAAGA